MNNDLLYQVAITRVPNIGTVHARTLINIFGNARDVFRASKKELGRIEGLGTIRINNLRNFNDFSSCEEELRFIEKFKIKPLFITDDAYPRRLSQCYDAPVMLFYRGTADLNGPKILSVVGTRNNSDFGRKFTEKLIDDLCNQDILITSGLAFGIDTIAHKAAIKNRLQTVGVLAHGLDRIYPAQNKNMAKDMISQGGLLTEFGCNTDPDRENFPRRNRIVAGMCDAIVVIESGLKGGSLITAELADGYNRDVFAVPGRPVDSKSEGCNHLIKNNRAQLVTSANEIIDFMNWNFTETSKMIKQKQLFIELSPEEQKIIDLLTEKGTFPLDELKHNSGLNSSTLASVLLNMEMQGLVTALPGRMFRVNHE